MVLALMVASGLVIGGCGAPRPVVDNASPVEPTTLPRPEHWAWSVTRPATGPSAPAFDRIVHGPGGFGVIATRGKESLWTSPDASTWKATEAADLDANALLDVAATADGGFLATGWQVDHGGRSVRFDAVSAEVTRFPDDSSVVAAVEPAGWGYLAVGGTVANEGQHALAWQSADGRAWRQTASIPGVFLGPLAGGSAGWVAVSNTSRAELGDGRADIWRSTDAAVWTHAASIANATVEAIVGGVDGYVAVGATSSGLGDLHPTVWQSVDGQTWTATERKGILGTFSAVVPWRNALVATGSAIDRPRGLLFASFDHVGWSAVEGIDLTGMRLNDVVSTPGSLVIVGEADRRSLVLQAKPSN